MAYVGTNSGQLVAVDPASGTVLTRVSVLGGVQDVTLGKDHLYVLTVGKLHAISLDEFEIVGSADSPGAVSSPGGRVRLFVGEETAYAVHSNGYNTFSLADPAKPALIAAGSTAQLGWKQIIANGSGLGVAAVGTRPRDDGTHVEWTIGYRPPMGPLGRVVAALFLNRVFQNEIEESLESLKVQPEG